MTLAQSHSQEIMLIHVEDYISLEKNRKKRNKCGKTEESPDDCSALHCPE